MFTYYYPPPVIFGKISEGGLCAICVKIFEKKYKNTIQKENSIV
jgi:hypothetical protein